MPAPRYKFGICSWCIPADQNAACAVAARIGLDGMEVDLGKVEDGLPLGNAAAQKELLEAADAASIALPTIGANTLCTHGMSKQAEEETVRTILSTISSTAAALGIKLIQLPSFIDGFITTEDELRLTAKNLQFVCRAAAESGALVGTENALSVDDNLRLLELVGEDNLRVYFDTSNPRWMGNMDTVPMIEPLAPYICEHHVKDQHQAPGAEKPAFVQLGTGDSSFHEAAAKIRDSGYEGWIHLENSYPVAGPTSVEDSVSLLAADVRIMREAFGGG